VYLGSLERFDRFGCSQLPTKLMFAPWSVHISASRLVSGSPVVPEVGLQCWKKILENLFTLLGHISETSHMMTW
jgi:hypothetical protein